MKKSIIAFVAVVVLILYSKPSFALNPPKWLVSMGTQNEVLLTWQLPEGAIKTIVYKKKENEEEFNVISKDALGFFMDKDVSEGIYIYKLQAIDTKGIESNFSEERYVLVEKKKNLVYTPPKWSESFSTEDRIMLRWENTCDVPIRGYNVYKKLAGESDFKLFGSVLDNYTKDVDVFIDKVVSYKVCPLDANLKELECSIPIDFLVVKDESIITEVPVFDFIVRKTIFEKFLKLPENREFISPTDIKLDEKGNIYVADTGAGLIHVFKYTGEYTQSVGIVLLKDGTYDLFENLLGIDIDKRGIIFGVDSYKGIIKGFDQKGVIVLKIDLFEVFREHEEYKFKKFGLVDVSVNNDKKSIYVVDNYNNHIFEFDLDGKLKRVILNKGQNLGQVHLPTFSYLDNEGNLLLADCMNHRIAVFDPDLQPKMSFGRVGDILGTFIRPKGICKNKEGDIFVADSYTNSIQVFSPEGEFKYLIANKEGKQPDIVTPNGIFVDLKDKIYIVEKLINRIQVRQMTDQILKIELPIGDKQ